MISALGTIQYGGVGVDRLIFVPKPAPVITRSVDGSQYTFSITPEGKNYEVFRASGPLGLFESVGTSSGTSFVDTVPDSKLNYIYRIKWLVESPFISIRSIDYYTIQDINIS